MLGECFFLFCCILDSLPICMQTDEAAANKNTQLSLTIFNYGYQGGLRLFDMKTFIYSLPPSVRHTVSGSIGPPSAMSSSNMALSPQPHLEYLGWGPSGNAFVYVHKSNLYYRDEWIDTLRRRCEWNKIRIKSIGGAHSKGLCL